MATQAKCAFCKIRIEWDNDKLRLRGALCPYCRHPLAPTSYEMKRWPTRRAEPVRQLEVA